VDGKSEGFLAVVEPGDGRLQLVETESLETLTKWFTRTQSELGQRQHQSVRDLFGGGWKAHRASVMSGAVRSAGLLPYRRDQGFEVLIAHPGGPYFARRDNGWWSIVKGIVEPDEKPEETAAREFSEETGWEVPTGQWIALGDTTLKSRKVVVAWAVEADLDPAGLVPGTFQMGGRRYPEIDRVEWVEPELARVKLNPAQVIFVDRLQAHLGL
jgi:predicted NUDIX family NTP pyrophosphohydrolase